MASISNKDKLDMLEDIPDFIDWDKALLWMHEGQKILSQAGEIKPVEERIVSLDWDQIEQVGEQPFGLYQSQLWRKFVLAVFFADHASYEAADSVDFQRLLFVAHAFPEGFRTWWIQLSDGRWWPVGYSGWYPMLESAFDIFEKTPQKLKDRMVVPDIRSKGDERYLYLFNYSVAPVFKGTILSKMLISRMAKDLEAQKAAGMACITVSKDGVRVAWRLGMSHAGDLLVDGCAEGVYTVRYV